MYGRAAVLVMTVFAVSSRADWNSVAEGEIPVTRFTGLTSVIYSNSEHVNLSWVVQPANATRFWIKCFVGNSTVAENQIYGYAFTEPPKSNASKEYRGRLTHKVYHIHNATVFQLTLSDPMYSDTGVYECLLHGSGSDDPIKARLTITYENKTQHSTSNHTAGGPDKEAGISITAAVLGTIGGLLGVASAAVFIARKIKNRRAEVKRKEQARRYKESILLKTADEDRKEDDQV